MLKEKLNGNNTLEKKQILTFIGEYSMKTTYPNEAN